jgi:hypothetical protein
MSHAWIGHTLVVSWTLVATVTMFPCQGDDCRPVQARTTRYEHTVGTFPTEEACDAARRTLTTTPGPTGPTAARPTIANKKELTATCVHTDSRTLP